MSKTAGHDLRRSSFRASTAPIPASDLYAAAFAGLSSSEAGDLVVTFGYQGNAANPADFAGRRPDRYLRLDGGPALAAMVDRDPGLGRLPGIALILSGVGRVLRQGQPPVSIGPALRGLSVPDLD